MKSKVLGVLLVTMLMVCGCGQRGSDESQKTPVKNENTQTPEKDEKEPVQNADKPGKEDSEESEKNITLYYIEESTGDTASKEVCVKGDLSKGIVEQLKSEKVLSEACSVQNLSVNSTEKTVDLAMNKAFGDYIRGMGTTGSEQVLECVVKTYLNAYECKGLKITEDGSPLDTGHTVLDGYMSYE